MYYFTEVDSEITGVATQGRGREPYSHWVTKYYVSFREEEGPWLNFTRPKQPQPVVCSIPVIEAP